ncbi:MAG: ABC transporter ATP-binding protein/permease, partial [Pseudomonadota bacterium]|nr:ABC transporter ATP-binding protein/permease [Pseudomonadota bacterium]
MEPRLFRYIWTHTRSQQLWILFIVLASLPTYFLSLELPKRIINGPIQGKGFEGPEAQDTILRTAIGLPDWLFGGQIVLFPGFTVDRMGALVILSLAFLALVCINGLFKFYINTYKGRLGERMLRRLRYELVDRVLRFPLLQFRRVKPAEVATMVKDEVEPLGGFIGDAFVQPVFLGGQALTAMVFILVQNVWLGLMAGAMVAVQAFIIPRLRRRLIVLGRQRQLTARELAGRVGEIVEGAASVHVNDTSNYERADIGTRLGRIFSIRYDLYQWKFFVKFLNNFLAQVTPFLFYLIGGYFALRGQLDIGQLVAVISAYKDLPSPIKELIDWDQQRVDVQVKYAQVIEQFTIDNILDPALQAPVLHAVPPLAGEVVVSQLTVTDDTGAKLLENAHVRFALHERVAAVGEINSGAETLAEVLARLVPYASGRVTLGERPLQDLPEAVTGRRIGYVGPDMFLAHGTIRDVLLYGLKHAPLRSAPPSEEDSRRRAREIAEAESAGNPTFDLRADWVDYEAAGATGPDDILEPIKRVLALLDLAEDVFGFGLRSTIDPAVDPKLAARIVEARQTLRQRLPELNLAQLVEPFHPERYNRQATVAENLLFGTARSPDFADGSLAANPYMQQVLARTGLDAALFDMGRRIASTAIELFADLPPDHPFFEQLSFMSAEQIPDYRTALARVEGRSYAEASPADRAMFMRLPFV